MVRVMVKAGVGTVTAELTITFCYTPWKIYRSRPRCRIISKKQKLCHAGLMIVEASSALTTFCEKASGNFGGHTSFQSVINTIHARQQASPPFVVNIPLTHMTIFHIVPPQKEVLIKNLKGTCFGGIWIYHFYKSCFLRR
jgi:hypothetical protein